MRGPNGKPSSVVVALSALAMGGLGCGSGGPSAGTDGSDGPAQTADAGGAAGTTGRAEAGAPWRDAGAAGDDATGAAGAGGGASTEAGAGGAGAAGAAGGGAAGAGAGGTSGAFPTFVNQGQFDLFLARLDPGGQVTSLLQAGNERPQHPVRLGLAPGGAVLVAGWDDTYIPTNYVAA